MKFEINDSTICTMRTWLLTRHLHTYSWLLQGQTSGWALCGKI